ncbi:hypothetical protein JYU34_008359 [Plutella xylostella]|uniref:C2H2-type domain-containing protein n=1 Tax=Plutella xylostella TaxID=51655 RepID=A0ABQ7QPA9_PLUXY|nr:hypothetical protein JYU34_008359 [Plutella xylostella]
MSSTNVQYKMEDDIDIEEHDLLNDPALQSVFPDLGILKREIRDFGIQEETHIKTEVQKGIVNEYEPDSSLEVDSGNLATPPPGGLDVKPVILCADTDDTLSVSNGNTSGSDKEESHIKKESENVVVNDLPFYRNRIILGKVNVDDVTEEECYNYLRRDPNNVVKNDIQTYNKPDFRDAKDMNKQKENCLLLKILLTDCHTSLLGNNCYCAQCAVLFPTTEAYSEHYTSTHTETTNLTKAASVLIQNRDKKFECDICNKRFTTRRDIVRHIFIHSDKRPFECETCKKRYKTKKYLVKHKLIHTGEKPRFECRICKKILLSKHSLVKHNSIHTGEKPFECLACKRRFRCLHHLKQHKCIHSCGDEKQKREKTKKNCAEEKKEKLFECDPCKKRFMSHSSLKSHKLIHTGEKPFECKTCMKAFRELGSLNQHKFIHIDQKLFSCEICDKSFTRKSYRLKHMSRHIGNKQFECETCKKRFSSISNMNQHKSTHKGEKTFQCDVCNKKYGSRSHLIRHMRVHTGKKPYECDVCHRRYRYSDSLKHHKSLKH